MENSKSKRSNTGYKGIYFNKENGKFRTRITLYKNGNGFEIGQYETLKEAIKARKEFIKSLF
jgi:hypothetical protein